MAFDRVTPTLHASTYTPRSLLKTHKDMDKHISDLGCQFCQKLSKATTDAKLGPPEARMPSLVKWDHTDHQYILVFNNHSYADNIITANGVTEIHIKQSNTYTPLCRQMERIINTPVVYALKLIEGGRGASYLFALNVRRGNKDGWIGRFEKISSSKRKPLQELKQARWFRSRFISSG